MKTANEITQSVMQRKHTYEKKKKARIRVTLSTLSLVIVCAVVTLTMTEPNRPDITPQGTITENDETAQTPLNNSGELNAPFMTDGESISNIYVGFKKLISENDGGDNACYAAPDNGDLFRSTPLNRALESYGDSARYRVKISLFKDKKELVSSSEEAQSIADRISASLMEKYGIGLSVLTSRDWYGREITEITLDAAEKEVIENFPVSDDFGCFLWLYSSNQTDDTGSSGTYNGGFVSADSAAVLRHNDKLYYQYGQSIRLADEDDYIKAEEFEAFSNNFGRFIGTAKNDVNSCIYGQHTDESFSSELSSNTEGQIYSIKGTDESEGLYLVHQYENGGYCVLLLKPEK